MSKKKTVSNHFKMRCLQRLGYVPNEKELVNKIQSGSLEFLYRESLRLTHWRWQDINGVNCILVYDKMRKQIVTVLFEYNEDYINNLKENAWK